MDVDFGLAVFFDVLFDFCRKWWHLIVVVVVAFAVIFGVYLVMKHEDDRCRAKGGQPIHTQDQGAICMKGGVKI